MNHNHRISAAALFFILALGSANPVPQGFGPGSRPQGNYDRPQNNQPPWPNQPAGFGQPPAYNQPPGFGGPWPAAPPQSSQLIPPLNFPAPAGSQYYSPIQSIGRGRKLNNQPGALWTDNKGLKGVRPGRPVTCITNTVDAPIREHCERALQDLNHTTMTCPKSGQIWYLYSFETCTVGTAPMLATCDQKTSDDVIEAIGDILNARCKKVGGFTESSPGSEVWVKVWANCGPGCLGVPGDSLDLKPKPDVWVLPPQPGNGNGQAGMPNPASFPPGTAPPHQGYPQQQQQQGGYNGPPPPQPGVQFPGPNANNPPPPPPPPPKPDSGNRPSGRVDQLEDPGPSGGKSVNKKTTNTDTTPV